MKVELLQKIYPSKQAVHPYLSQLLRVFEQRLLHSFRITHPLHSAAKRMLYYVR